jgi:hypothetical protein
MIPDKEEGPPPSEGPSEKSVRVTGPLEHPPPPTGQNYTPDITGEKGARWAKIPGQATDLSLPLLRLLVAYSKFAGGRTRIATVSENTIAIELGWFWTSKATGETHPQRRRVNAKRKELIALGYMLPAGKRCIYGKWLDAFIVAPYTEKHIDLASKWQFQTYVTRTLSTPDAHSQDRLMRTESAHIQRFTDFKTEVESENSNGASSSASRLAPQDQDQERTEEEHEGKGNLNAVSEWLDRTTGRRRG